MARITVEGCLDKVESRFELILLASGRARQLSTTSREPMVEWEDDKPTIVALREIEEGLITKEILDQTVLKIPRIRSVFSEKLSPQPMQSEAGGRADVGFLPAGTQRKSIAIFFLFFLTVTL